MPIDPAGKTEIEKEIVRVLQGIFDAEIPVNIHELGLIYDIRTAEDGHVDIDMTLTSPMCPVAGSLPPEVQHKVSTVPGVMTCEVKVVWEPPWEPSKMSEAARLQLNVG